MAIPTRAAVSSSYATFREWEDAFLPMLDKCTTALQFRQIHAQIIKSFLSQSTFLATRLIDTCSKIRTPPDYAAKIFNQIKEPTVFVYNSIIKSSAYAGRHTSAITLFKQMLGRGNSVTPDEFTYPLVIKSCGVIQSRKLGKQVHGCVVRVGLGTNLVVANSMLDMYTKCGSGGGVGSVDLTDAHSLFDEMSDRNAVSWNCLLSGHVRVGGMKKARAIFDEMPEKTVVSWTAMISGYTEIGCYADALEVFREMQMVAGVAPDEISVVSALPACAQLGALEVGKWIHFYCRKNGLARNTSVCNALIEMYCRCGSVSQALQVFDEMGKRDVISWSTMIAGLANHGKGQEAIRMFEKMQRAGIKPNGITFLGVLSACTHSGFHDKGKRYFDSMENDHNIQPGIQHYSCLVDILGRGGKLSQALDLIEKMPMKPDAKIWGSLLSSCRTHRNVDVAEIAMERLMEFEPDDMGNYVLLSNIYADLGMWECVSRIRKLVKSRCMKKTPGCSSIEVDGVVREYVSGENTKSFAIEFCWMLGLLKVHMRKRGEILESFPE